MVAGIDGKKTFSSILENQPEAFFLQEESFDLGKVKILQNLGYNIERYQYIFGKTRGYLTIGYAGERSSLFGELMVHPQLSFPPIRKMFEKKYGMEDIVYACPIIKVNDRWIGTFHNTSYSKYKGRMSYMASVLRLIKKKTFYL